MKYFDLVKPAIDSLGVITQGPTDNFDGGDTAQREGMFAFAAYILHELGKMNDDEFRFCIDRYVKIISLLNDPNHNGLLRRYPDPSYWGGLSDRLSRDQSTPNVISMGLVSRDSLSNFFKAHLKYRALLFLTNTRNNWAWPPGDPRYNATDYKWKLPDVTIMSFHGLYVRAHKSWLFYPLLWLTDLELVANALIKVLWYGKNEQNNDDLSHLMTQYQAELSMPTLWSKLAKWIYSFRKFPANSGDAKNPAQAAMNAYFNGSNPGPQLQKVYEEINAHFFG